MRFALPGPPIADTGSPAAIAITPNGKTAYVLHHGIVLQQFHQPLQPYAASNAAGVPVAGRRSPS